MLPFSLVSYQALVGQYHAAVWPAQLIGLGLMVGALGLVVQGRPPTWLMTAKLVATWAWTGVVFLGLFLSGLSFFAPALAAVFVLQAAVLLWRGRLAYGSAQDLVAWVGASLMTLAVAGTPLVARLSGTPWEAVPLAGTSPTPTALFTLGLLLTVERPRLLPALLPTAWMGGAVWAAWALDWTAGIILPLAGLGGAALLAAKALNRRRGTAAGRRAAGRPSPRGRDQ